MGLRFLDSKEVGKLRLVGTETWMRLLCLVSGGERGTVRNEGTCSSGGMLADFQHLMCPYYAVTTRHLDLACVLTFKSPTLAPWLFFPSPDFDDHPQRCECRHLHYEEGGRNVLRAFLTHAKPERLRARACRLLRCVFHSGAQTSELLYLATLPGHTLEADSVLS